jgi:CDK inhibitor PHO81
MQTTSTQNYQLNYIYIDPVFLGTICGKESEKHISVTALGSGRGEKHVSSIGAAIEFAKANNLLGLLVDSDLLVGSRLA